MGSLLAPWDQLRGRALRAALGLTPLASIVRNRDRRVAAVATAGVCMALALTVVAPAVLFAVSPVLLGVPHVAADVRYLVLRRNLSSRWRWSVFGVIGILVAVRAAQELGGSEALLDVEVAIGSAWLAAAAVAGALAAKSPRRLAVAAPFLAAVSWGALRDPYMAVVLLSHLHNLVALGLWLLLFRRRRWAVALPVAMVGLALVATLSGATLPLTEQIGARAALGVDLAEVSTWLCPGLAPERALPATVAYVFLQAVHYSVWLGWIPQEDLRSEGTLTFRMSARGMLRDFGVIGLAGVILAALAVVAFAWFDLLRTREVYLSLAAFHGYLELVMFVYLTVSRAPTPATGPRRAATPALA